MKYSAKLELAYDGTPKASVVETISNLQKRRWDFVFIRNKFVLDFYTVLARASKRHKFRFMTETRYTRLDRRVSNLELSDVEIPDEVIDLVRKAAANYYLTADVERTQKDE